MKKLLILIFIPFVVIFAQPLNWEAKVDRVVKYALPTEGPGGSLIISKGGNIIYNKSFGHADDDNENTPETVYQIGSISKQFTAAAILLLVQEKKLSIEDTLTKFIPDYPAPGNKVTIKHLLTHTSGIKNFTSLPEWNPKWESKRTLAEVIELFKHKDFDFQPGERWAYNNSGYALLAYIIEQASGMSYDMFMMQKIFVPLGMEKSRHGGSADNIGMRANGYTYNREQKKITKAVFTEFAQLSGAGSLISTVGDLLLWDEAIKQSKLLSSTLWEEFNKPHVKVSDDGKLHYGYGVMVQEWKGRKIIWHNGGMAGFRASYYRLVDDGYTLIWLGNSDFVDPDDLLRQVAGILIDIYNDNRKTIEISETELKQYVGKYISAGTAVNVTLDDAGLKFQFTDFPSLPLTLQPSAKDSFFTIENYLTNAIFSRNEKQEVIAIALLSGRQKLRLYKEGFEPRYEKKELTVEELKQFQGTYLFAPGAELNIYLRDGKLYGFIKGQPEYHLVPVGNNTFQLENLNGFMFVFELNEKREVIAVISKQPNGEFRALRK